MQESLGTYLLLERYFMEESVLKAIILYSIETGQQCSSMLDDVFFIIRKCIRRSNGTQSLDGVCAVVNNAASCLEPDFINALKSPLKSGYPTGYIGYNRHFKVQSSKGDYKLVTLNRHVQNFFKPRLHPWVDQFINHNHNLAEEELASYEARETFIQLLIVQVDALLTAFKTALTPRNYDGL
ncbi:conserved oligomeric Golgi complex subunit 4-like [Malaya genurostris]|uniref:conserved oligomeric Golgi complex subunit 4-like n=1 Tax=Malaya genurostris TaxID=325434 RepID=UPI0026F3913D|nr:conserved oligomeric Golgi complex subunit 4-like [Malaya genurostris]